MKKYKYLLLDLDDTIFDFQLAEEKALTRLFKELAPSFNQKKLTSVYKKINQQLWAKYEKGEISKKEIIESRFTLTFREIQIELDGKLAANTFQNYLGHGFELLEGAMNTLEKLVAGGYKLYAATNGLEKTQQSRLEGSGIIKFFSAIYISERTGSQKPNPAFFNYIFENSPEINRVETLIIGDSPSSDILGGKQANIDSCWYNEKHLTSQIEATYIVNNHSDLQKLLLG